MGLTLRLKGWGAPRVLPKELYSTMRFTRVQAVGYQHRKPSGIPGASSVCCASGLVPWATQGCHTTPMYSVGMSEDL